MIPAEFGHFWLRFELPEAFLLPSEANFVNGLQATIVASHKHCCGFTHTYCIVASL